MRQVRQAAVAQCAVALVALAAGCQSDNNNRGAGLVTHSTPVANGATFVQPLDAVPSPDGTQIYFTGVQPGSNPGGPAVFKVAAAGGTPTALAAGGVLGAPLGIAASSDGSKVYVADPAAQTDNDRGGIFSISTGGGTPALLAETADYAPRAITVAKVGGSDNIYFIGDDKADGASGVFKDASGAVSTVIKGSAAGDPAAVAVATDGTVYILDGSGKISKVAAGGSTATALGGGAHDLAVSAPAGMDLAQDQSALLVAVTDPATGKDSVARVVIVTGAVTQIAAGLGGSEPGGLHRALNADVYTFVDPGAGDGTGTVYLLKK